MAHRIDTPSAQKDKFGAGKNGFTRGNPQTGEQATALDDDYFDMLQEELVGIVESAGIALDKAKHDQLQTALKKLFLSRANPFGDIKADGATAIAKALENLGLSNVVYGGFDGDDIARPYMWYSTTGQSVYLTTNVFLSSELDKKQPLDATLTALAGLLNGANKLPYFTGADQMATADLSAFIRTMLGKADAAAVLAYLGIPDALALKADLSSFHTTRSNTFIAANQPFTGASSGVLRFMCGEFTGTTDKDGNLTVTLPDTYLGKIIYAEAHQFSGGYAGNIDPLIFSSYVLPNTAAASVTFAVRNTKTGMAASNVQLSCLYFTRGV